jgi:hypothetical protein
MTVNSIKNYQELALTDWEGCLKLPTNELEETSSQEKV